MPEEYRSILIFSVCNNQVATLPFSTPSTDDIQSLTRVGLGLTFGESKPVPSPDDYVAVDWETLEVIPETSTISKISGSSIVLSLPNMPLSKLQDRAANVIEWVMQGEMRREVEKQLEHLAIMEMIRQGKIKFD